MAKIKVVWTGGGSFESADGKIQLVHNEPKEIEKKDFDSLTKNGLNPDLYEYQDEKKK